MREHDDQARADDGSREPGLTAEQAATRLGVKKATLYAYVSRGVLHRRVAMDGRTSLFDEAEIDALRRRSRRVSSGELATVISSGVSEISDDRLRYGTIDVADLVAGDTDFEAVADALWGTDGDWFLGLDARDRVLRVQAGFPDSTPPLDRLRASVAVASATDELRHDRTAAGVAAAGRRMIAAMVDGLPLRITPEPSTRLADGLWDRLATIEPDPMQLRAVNATLVMLADHGLATSTYAVRVAASTRADPYGAVTAGLGALGGPLHGAASRRVHRLFERAAETGPAKAVGEFLARDEVLPGTGHAVYRTRDPRHAMLWSLLLDGWIDDPRLETARELRMILGDRTDGVINIDFSVGALTWLSGMDPEAGEVMFAIARTAGWLAHTIEEYDEEPLRFRARARRRRST